MFIQRENYIIMPIVPTISLAQWQSLWWWLLFSLNLVKSDDKQCTKQSDASLSLSYRSD